MKNLIQRILPDSIVGRTVLVLVVGLLLSHAVALLLYSGNRLETLSVLAGREASERLAQAAEAARDATTRDDMRAVRRVVGPNLRLAWAEKPVVTAESDTLLARALRERLARRLGAGVDVRVAVSGGAGLAATTGDGPVAEMGQMPMNQMPMGPMRGWGRGEGWFAGRAHEAMHGAPGRAAVWASIGFPDATVPSAAAGPRRWLNLFMPLEAGESLWGPRFGFPFLVLTFLALGLTVWAVRRASQPLKTFAAAARSLGADAHAPPLPLDGPREVREAALAFNDMQARIRRFVEDRTRMIAAMSHDLRTPITRLRLRAELMEDGAAKDKMLADLDEMEKMVSATLAFARDDAAPPGSSPFDIVGLLKGLVADGAARGLKGDYVGPDARVVSGDALALKRAFANILDNAWRYGGAARVHLADGAGRIEVTVDDDGPGIAEAERENVFRPFYRIEGSRSRETGGTGLGLALARSAILAHGGAIELANRPEGGLSVKIGLPE